MLVNFGTPGQWHDIVGDTRVADLPFGVVEVPYLRGGVGGDKLTGSQGNDTSHGGPSDDIIRGLGGDGRLHGQGGDDRIAPGQGHDIMWGGDGADRFIFLTADDVGGRAGTLQPLDSIVDFDDGVDLIDLSHIPPNDLGARHPSCSSARIRITAPGQIRYSSSATGVTVMGSTDDDPQVEFALVLQGPHSLVRGDFVL